MADFREWCREQGGRVINGGDQCEFESTTVDRPVSTSNDRTKPNRFPILVLFGSGVLLVATLITGIVESLLQLPLWAKLVLIAIPVGFFFIRTMGLEETIDVLIEQSTFAAKLATVAIFAYVVARVIGPVVTGVLPI